MKQKRNAVNRQRRMQRLKLRPLNFKRANVTRGRENKERRSELLKSSRWFLNVSQHRLDCCNAQSAADGATFPDSLLMTAPSSPPWWAPLSCDGSAVHIITERGRGRSPVAGRLIGYPGDSRLICLPGGAAALTETRWRTLVLALCSQLAYKTGLSFNVGGLERHIGFIPKSFLGAFCDVRIFFCLVDYETTGGDKLKQKSKQAFYIFLSVFGRNFLHWPTFSKLAKFKNFLN